MDRAQLRDEIVFRLTGGLLSCELEPAAIDKLINIALREIQRYYAATKLITVPYQACIDLSEYDVSSVSRVYRAEGFVDSDKSNESTADPMLASQWQLLSGTGNLLGYSDFAYNYSAYNTLLQIRNTTSTDLAFRFQENKLYVNIASNKPDKITIEYVKRLEDVSEITSDYWIDNLCRLCVALAKITLGRIRSRYTQSNSLYQQDGDTLLQEGNAELEELRTYLQANTQLVYPID